MVAFSYGGVLCWRWQRLRRGFWRAARVSPLGGREEGYVAIGILCKPVYSGFDGFVLVILESLTNDY